MQPSLFIFAVLHKELGGPPAFRVNGLAAGFGYNRRLKLPSIEEVQDFPLVRAALGRGLFHPERPRDPIQAAMRRLRDYIPPAIGEYWFSVGIRFNSFEMIQSFAMLSVSFGSDLHDLRPRARRADHPQRAPARPRLRSATQSSPCVPSSILGRDPVGRGAADLELVHLRQGLQAHRRLRLFIWFKGAHQGDFVITLGGYHPKFAAPAHYPAVPRLGVNWIVGLSAHLRRALLRA